MHGEEEGRVGVRAARQPPGAAPATHAVALAVTASLRMAMADGLSDLNVAAPLE